MNLVLNEFKKNDFDILLLTGDISDDGSLESYEFVLNLLDLLT
jgi:3',5'-cyclic AMP phosphodiesterase CpdA